MDLRFNTSLAESYKSDSQIARVLTEDWLARTNPSRSIEYSQERQESGQTLIGSFIVKTKHTSLLVGREAT